MASKCDHPNDPLYHTEIRYRALVESAQDLFWQCNTQGVYIYLNPAWEATFGYTQEEMLGKTPKEFQPPEYAQKDRKEFLRLMQGNNIREYETVYLSKDGREIHLFFSAASLLDENGKIVGAQGTAYDITERKKSEEKYRSLFNKMLDGCALHEIICDAQGRPIDYRFLSINPAFEHLTGLKAENLIGKTVLDVLPGIEKYWIDTYGKVALTGEPVSFDNFSQELNKHYRVTAYRPAPNQFACIFQDITPHIKAEEEKKAFEAQLRHTQKMEAIGTLAGGIAHDFNNILTAIIGYSEMAHDDLPDWNPARQQLKEVLKAGHRAKGLVKQILAFSSTTTQCHAPIQPHLIIEEALVFLRATLPATIVIQTNLDPDCGNILADTDQIHQVLMNLCTNAAHAMEENGGVLRICLNTVTLTAGDIKNEAELLPGDYILLSIEDTGVGITRKNLERIFDPYFTTKPVGKGTGMGLSVVHGIVKNHNAMITVESTPGKGSTFTLFFPRIDDKRNKTLTSPKSLPMGNETILIVDDDPEADG